MFDPAAIVTVQNLTHVFNAERGDLGHEVKQMAAQSLTPSIVDTAFSVWNKRVSVLKNNDRLWILSPSEVQKIISDDPHLSNEKKDARMLDDQRRESMLCKKINSQTASRQTVICGLRFKYIGEQGASQQVPTKDVSVNPFALSTDNPQHEQWAESMFSIRSHSVYCAIVFPRNALRPSSQ